MTDTTQTRQARPGFIAHTEFASADPAATKTWCAEVLGWEVLEPLPTPSGPYHMWSNIHRTGGGIRTNNPPEQPGTISYVEVEDIEAVHANALENGASQMFGPEALPDGSKIAIVKAPGDVPVGFWSPN